MAAHLGVSLREFARRVGVSEGAVRAGIKRGRVTPLADGTLDPEVAAVAWRANAHPGRTRPTGRPGTAHRAGREVDDYNRSRTALSAINAQIKQLELRKLQGELLERGEVERMAFAESRRARDLLMAMGTRLGPMVAGVTDPAECARIIDAEVRQVAEQLSAAES